MDHARPQDTQQSKGSTVRHRECSDESVDKRPTDSSVSPLQDEKRAIRRVQSPSRPRAWSFGSYKPKFGGRFYRPRFPRDDHPFYKPGSSIHRYHHFKPRVYFDRRDHFQPKLHHSQRASVDRSSPPKQNNSKFMPGTEVCENSDNIHTHSRERDHRGTKSKEREQSRDRELPSTASQTAARDRAIQQKRKEIDEVYYQECEMFGLVAKMLIEKDPSLERPIQSSLQENLRDIGKRCVEAMEKFIEDYDSREPLH
uniref:Periphilin-1 C-terminal domain-containing protein n=1 Tax=Lates calcarifer TaxID=8187 RepID=A0A4W6EQA0_LATCA